MADKKINKTQADKVNLIKRVYNCLLARPYSVILLAALFYNVGFKFHWAVRLDMVVGFWRWILTDIAFIAGAEIVCVLICYLRPKCKVIRTITFITALICAWSVINAAWMRRTGTQVLPHVLLPLVLSPVNGFTIVGHNLIMMPVSSVILLGFSGLLLVFFFHVMYKCPKANYKRSVIISRVIISSLIILSTSLARHLTKQHDPNYMVSSGLRSNCHLRAFVSLIPSRSERLTRSDFVNGSRVLPVADETADNDAATEVIRNNIVVIVLEGVQRQYTSLTDKKTDRTPFLASIAEEGIELTNFRCTVTHTTKALFSLFTGLYPSVSQDIAEAVPRTEPYRSLATILKDINYRTAFFQSAKGNFECRPALVSNLGFDKFYSRDDLADPNCFVGSLGSDEFALLKPITEWIDSDQSPFFLVMLSSVTHDPYVVPQWFAEPKEEPVERYFQTIRYTDKFISSLYIELEKRRLTENTIFCVVGDHGEAFGEHGLFFGHERIAYDEALHVVSVIKAPMLITESEKKAVPASSVDFTPTLLSIMGFDINIFNFDGKNILAEIPAGRKVYFAGWLEQSPLGFVQSDVKYIYNPVNKSAMKFNLSKDPLELSAIPLLGKQTDILKNDLLQWRKSSLYKLPSHSGKQLLFDRWKCRWTGRFSSAKYKNGK